MIDPIDTVTAQIPELEPAPQLPAATVQAWQPGKRLAIEPRWLVILRQAEIDAGKSGCTGVAKRLVKPKTSPSVDGKPYSRMYVSQYINDINNPLLASAPFIESVLTAFGNGRIDCPHQKTLIPKAQCHALAALSWGQVMGTGEERLEQWRACHACTQNPANSKAKL
jgi:hypothetical protein